MPIHRQMTTPTTTTELSQKTNSLVVNIFKSRSVYITDRLLLVQGIRDTDYYLVNRRVLWYAEHINRHILDPNEVNFSFEIIFTHDSTLSIPPTHSYP